MVKYCKLVANPSKILALPISFLDRVREWTGFASLTIALPEELAWDVG